MVLSGRQQGIEPSLDGSEAWSSPRLFYLVLAVVLFAFFLVCARYSTHLNLWGDEAFTLAVAEGNARADPNHLPTYFTLMKVLVSILPGTRELLLRLTHALVFALGLLFAGLSIRRLAGETLALVTVGLAILLPDFQFYATNLRMYALLFLAAMAHVYVVTILVQSPGRPRLRFFFLFVVTGTFLSTVDYSGFIYYVVTAAFLLILWLHRGHERYLKILLLPALPVLLFLAVNTHMIGSLLAWDVAGYQGHTSSSILGLMRSAYFACRPALDLVYPAALPTGAALVLPAALFASVVFSAVVCWYSGCSRTAISLAVVLGFTWVALIPFGFTFPRLFLPSQLFMVFLLVLAASRARAWLRVIPLVAAGVLVLVNLSQTVRPTYPLYSVIPYSRIADDAADVCRGKGICRVLVSDNTLNSLSILRYLEREPDVPRLHAYAADQDSLRALDTVENGSPFIFISDMGERNRYVDIGKLQHRRAVMVSRYVPLDALPYNAMWRHRYEERARQPDAVELWVVE